MELKTMLEFDNEFTVECLGSREEYVYDIEVEKNHNFFGNDICVHNSVYITMEDLVSKFEPQDPVNFIDKICQEKLEPLIDKRYQELFEMLNGYKNSIKMSREVIADVGIWQAKKRYVLNVLNSEGVQYAEPHLKIMGIEAIKSSSPRALKEHFKNAFKIVMFGTEKELHEYVKKVYNEFKTLPPENISFPRGISEIDKWVVKDGFMKRTPIHVRGSIVYNRLLEQYNLPYERIKNGNKVKFIYLKVPNPTRSNVVSFKNELHEIFGLNQYIDYDLQFQKSFDQPLQMITKLVNWTNQEVNTIEDLFV